MYDYKEIRGRLFTDEGQRLFLQVRDRVGLLLKQAGAVRMQEIMLGLSGDTWTMLAAVDRMVELKEVLEITQPNSVPGQFRVFISMSN